MKRPTHHANPPEPPLAAELEALIARVVKRARLRKGEREDVRRELRSHFGAALEEGKSAVDVVGEFGDVKAAGRMIGRAKRRCRGIVWHAWVWSCRGVMGLFAVVVVMYGYAAWCYYGASPTITRNYLKEINDPIRALDPSECALPEYEAVYYSFSQDETERMQGALNAAIGEPRYAYREWAMELLRLHLPRIRAAAHRPHMGWVATGDDRVAPHVPSFDLVRSSEFVADEGNRDLLGVLLTPLNMTRVYHPALIIDLDRAIDSRDRSTMVADLEALVGMCLQIDQMGFAIAHQSAVACAIRVLDRVRVMAGGDDGWLTSADLRDVAHIVGRLETLTTTSFDVDKGACMDVNQRLFSAGPFGPAILNARAFNEWRITSKLRLLQPGEVLSTREGQRFTEAWDPGVAIVSETRSEAERFTAELFRRVESDSKLNPWEAGELSSRQYLADPGGIGSKRFWLSRAMGFDAERTITQTWRLRGEFDATLGVLAAECFRRDRGRWPKSWAELVPAYLPSTPIDMFDGNPLRMGEREGVWFVYSIGVDRTDDGGRASVDAEGNYSADAAAGWVSRAAFEAMPPQERRAREGDWIVWPPIDENTGQFVLGGPLEGSR